MPDDDPKDRSSTPTLEPGVERLVSRIHVSSEESTGKETTGDDDPNNDANLSDSELFAELEKEDEADLAALREKRMEQLKAE
ncbi:hypothetical protein FRB99_005761 [Tulasnella sp. 403]|nr:hypothetical protein FRB99_005761 [Tulasnella sp. 403]